MTECSPELHWSGSKSRVKHTEHQAMNNVGKITCKTVDNMTKNDIGVSYVQREQRNVKMRLKLL